MGGWRGKAVYLRYQARFSIFWYIKNEVIFHLFWYQWHPIECLGQTNNIQPTEDVFRWGVWCYLGMGVDRTNMGNIFCLGVGTNIPSSEQPYCQWMIPSCSTVVKKRFNTTINWYRRTFFYQWVMVTDQCGSLQHQIRLYFFITKSADMDGDRWGWRDRANNNKQKNTYHGYDKWEGFKVLIAMIGSA